jgi:hypothetical protein
MENVAENEKIDISEYEMAEEYAGDKLYFDLMNIFMVYYQQLFNRPSAENMFHGINLKDDSSTNMSLEIFYEAVHFYNTSEEKYVKLYEEDEFAILDSDKNDDTSLYIVKINDKCKYTYSLITALLFVSDNDWTTCKWSIFKAKN